MSMSKIWGIRAGSTGEADEIFLAVGQIALSFAGCGPEIGRLPNSKEAFRKHLAGTPWGLRNPDAVASRANQLHRFIHELTIGDRIVYARRFDRTLHWGEVFGPYEHREVTGRRYTHRRNAHWWRYLPRDCFSHGALYELGCGMTLFEVRGFADEFRHKFELEEAPRPLTPRADRTAGAILADLGDTTLDFISRRLRAALKGYPMEAFVADLFHAMGYHAQVTRKSRDGGTDIVAHRDELGLEPPILQIQVKSTDESIGAEAVKAFAATIGGTDVGVIATTAGFAKGAHDFAKGLPNVRLIDGVELVQLVQKHYEGLSGHHRRMIPLRRTLVPDLTVELE